MAAAGPIYPLTSKPQNSQFIYANKSTHTASQEGRKLINMMIAIFNNKALVSLASKIMMYCYSPFPGQHRYFNERLFIPPIKLFLKRIAPST